MTTLTVHNLDDAMEKQLQISAKRHNCSTEEAYRILKQALFPVENQKNLGSLQRKDVARPTRLSRTPALPTNSFPEFNYTG